MKDANRFTRGLLLLLLLWLWALPVLPVTLAWDASARAQGYILSYGAQSRQYTQHLDAGTATAAAVKDLPPGQQYFFGVQAYNTKGYSAYSNEVMVLAQAQTPPPIKPYTMKEGWLSWDWIDVDPSVTDYVIDCGKATGAYTIHKTFPITTPKVLMVDVVGRNVGTWYCQQTMLAGTVRRAVSNELPFDLLGSVLLRGVSQ